MGLKHGNSAPPQARAQVGACVEVPPCSENTSSASGTVRRLSANQGRCGSGEEKRPSAVFSLLALSKHIDPQQRNSYPTPSLRQPSKKPTSRRKSLPDSVLSWIDARQQRPVHDAPPAASTDLPPQDYLPLSFAEHASVRVGDEHMATQLPDRCCSSPPGDRSSRHCPRAPKMAAKTSPNSPWDRKCLDRPARGSLKFRLTRAQVDVGHVTGEEARCHAGESTHTKASSESSPHVHENMPRPGLHKALRQAPHRGTSLSYTYRTSSDSSSSDCEDNDAHHEEKESAGDVSDDAAPKLLELVDNCSIANSNINSSTTTATTPAKTTAHETPPHATWRKIIRRVLTTLRIRQRLTPDP